MSSEPSAEISYLLSLEAVRERSRITLAAAEAGSLNSFDYDASRMPATAQFVIDVINRDFGPDKFSEIPPHGRWQHFDVGGSPRIAPLVEAWTAAKVDKVEITRRLIDLFFVSVLLDAGAGNVWKFEEPKSKSFYNRSEGIAVASLYMFLDGVFNSTGTSEPAVDAAGLVGLTEDQFIKSFQITEENPLIGVSPRVALMHSIGRSLQQLPDIVGLTGRPGNIVDYLLKSAKEPGVLDYKLLWSTLQKILIPSWPDDRPKIDGYPIGDAWPLKVLAQKAEASGASSVASTIQPFHKLTQWLCYSLVVPFVRILDLRVENEQLGTGLPEYRNGGLFVDLGVLTLKPEVVEQHKVGGRGEAKFSSTEDAIVEWRALTVALLDELYTLISANFAKQGVRLSMAQMLEAGTWKSGRELAAKLRPETKASPILLDADGTLF